MTLPFAVTIACRTRRSSAPSLRRTRPRLSSFATWRPTSGLYPPQREYRADGSHVESLVMEIEPATPAEPYHLPLLVPQFLTEAVMRERLAELGHLPAF